MWPRHAGAQGNGAGGGWSQVGSGSGEPEARSKDEPFLWPYSPVERPRSPLLWHWAHGDETLRSNTKPFLLHYLMTHDSSVTRPSTTLPVHLPRMTIFLARR